MKRKPFVPLQSEPTDCAFVAIAAVSAVLGYPGCAEALKREYGVSSRGTKISQLTKMLRERNFTAQPVLISKASVSELRLPAIALWENRHYVVLANKRGDRYDLFDPELGWRTVHTESLALGVSGLAVEVGRGVEAPSPTPRRPLSLSKWVLGFSVKSALARLFLLALSAQAAAVLLPALSQRVIDSIHLDPNARNLTVTLAAYGVVSLLGIGMASLMSRASAKTSISLSGEMTLDVVRRLFGLPLAFLNRNSATALFGKVQTVQTIQQIFLQVATSTVVLGGSGVLAGVALLLQWPSLGLPLVGITVVGAAVDHLWKDAYAQLSERRHTATVRQMSRLLEAIRTAAPLTAAQALKRVVMQIAVDTRALNEAQLAISVAEQTRSDISKIFESIAQLLYLGLGTWLMARKALTLGEFVAIGMYRQFAASGAIEIQRFLGSLFVAKAAAARLEAIVDPSNSAPTFDARSPVEMHETSIAVENLCFRYSSFDPYVLENVSLRVAQGESVAIVGASGSGKSTLAKLLAGQLEPCDGTISYGRQRLTSASAANLLSQVGCVMQNDHLISDSILENIRLFRDIPEEQIRQAAATASIHAWIESLPMGYLTPVSDEFSGVSGGQRQRILLARALAGRPKVLILDEATSALDAETERQIAKNISVLTITRVLFAHREETIRSADRVIRIAASETVFCAA